MVDVGTDRRVLAALALLLLVAAVAGRALRAGTTVVAAVLTAGLASALLKALVDRPRPPSRLALVQALGSSMPSSVAALSASATAALVATAWLARWRHRSTTSAVLVASTALVGLCLVYLGVHWPSDVLAGWLLGAAVGVPVAWLLRDRHLSRGWVQKRQTDQRPVGLP